MYCTHCGKHISKEGKYCSHCGAEQLSETHRDNKNIPPSKTANSSSDKSKTTYNPENPKQEVSAQKRVLYWIVYLLSFIIVGSVVRTVVRTVFYNPPIVSSKSYDGSDWVTFTAPYGNFSALTPSEPKVQEISAPIEGSDETVTMYMYSSEINKNDQLAFGYAKYPEIVDISDPTINLEGGMNGSIANIKGELSEYNHDTFMGFPSIEYTGKTNNYDTTLYVKGLIFMDEYEIYLIMEYDTTGEFKGFETLKNSFMLSE